MKKSLLRRLAILAILAILCAAGAARCAACTLWAAAGKAVSYRGTLIAKNRDSFLGQKQRLKFIRYHKKFSYIGLFAGEDASLCIKAGVNERGLVIVNAAASAIRLDKKPYPQTLLGKLLSRCTDIEDALSHPQWFHGARFLLLADSRRIATVEIGKDGVFKVKKIVNGKLCHTNHYLQPELQFLNPAPPRKSSLTRLRLIKKYLRRHNQYTFADFINISGLQDKGPNNSLWRSGGTPAGIRTLATWIVWQPRGGTPVLYVRLINSRQQEKEYYYDLNKAFTDRRLKSETAPQIYGDAGIPKPYARGAAAGDTPL